MNLASIALCLGLTLTCFASAQPTSIVDSLREPTEPGSADLAGELTADEDMAVRSEPKFGMNIVRTIPAGETFTVQSRKGAWFQVDGGWTYISFNDDGGLKQRKVSQAAFNLHDQTPFPYDPATEGGNLGCAQVVSTALKSAGVLDRTSLAVLEVKSMLQAKGWQTVPPGQWKDGDVVMWSTYDTSGDGVKDPDTHIGIVVVQNGTAFAINNSSVELRPVKNRLDSFPAPVTTVMRMGGR